MAENRVLTTFIFDALDQGTLLEKERRCKRTDKESSQGKGSRGTHATYVHRVTSAAFVTLQNKDGG